MRVTILCVSLSLIAIACSQVPRPCVAPAQWNAHFFQRDRRRHFMAPGRIEYDASNQRIAYIYKDENTGITTFDILLFQEKVRYNVIIEQELCTKSELTDPFKPIGIPNNATFFGEFIIGTSAGDGVTVEQWGGNVTYPVDGEYLILVTVKDCLPVNDIFYDEATQDVIENFFSDVTLGISDPNYFIPPNFCF